MHIDEKKRPLSFSGRFASGFPGCEDQIQCCSLIMHVNMASQATMMGRTFKPDTIPLNRLRVDEAKLTAALLA